MSPIEIINKTLLIINLNPSINIQYSNFSKVLKFHPGNNYYKNSRRKQEILTQKAGKDRNY